MPVNAPAEVRLRYKYRVAATRSSQILIEATLQLIAESGVDSLTISQVAARAGVSRATAYREFGDKDKLLSAVAAREVQQMVAETMAGIDPAGDPVRNVPAVVLAALAYLRRHAAFRYVREHEPHWLLQAVLTIAPQSMNLVQVVAVTVAPIIASSQAKLWLPAAEAAEIVVRTVLSHALVEQSYLTDEQVAESVLRAIRDAD
ncbi:MAG: helix-turn-helix domain-containing protein [Mycobacterium sp.]